MLRAVIFDMDGVICDSEKLHMQAFQRVLQEEGMFISDNDYYEKYLAHDDRGCFTAVFSLNNKPLDAEKMKKLLAHKAKYFDEQMKEKLVIYPGAENFVKKVAERYPIALASGARRLEVEYVLKKANIRGLFASVISADDVQKGKPDPESFVTALKTLNDWRLQGTAEIKSSECLVIEDSLHGIAAAHAAGMKSCALPTSFKPEQLKAAHIVADSLVGLELTTLEKIFI